MKCPDGYQIFNDPLNLRDKTVMDKYIPYGIPFLLLFVVLLIYFLIEQPIFNACIILILALILIFPTHEVCHYLFQWIYSRKRPHLGCHRFFPFSALDNAAELSIQQAISAAIAPFICITGICIISAIITYRQDMIIVNTITNIQALKIIGIVTFGHIAVCSADFYLIKWLLKSPRNAILRQRDLINILCVPTRRQQTINKPTETLSPTSPTSPPDTNSG